MPKNQHQTIGPSYFIEQRAIQIFTGLISNIGLIREQKPDFFIDYLVETVVEGEPTGFKFAVQLKGTQRLPGRMCYAMDSKHLRYYARNIREPMFIVIVDVSSRKAYWVFSQKYIASKISKEKLDTAKTVSIRIDENDNLADTGRFCNALKEAESYMRDRWPGSVAAAIGQRRKQLSILDERIDVRVSHDGDREVIALTSKESLDIRWRLKGAQAGSGEALRNFSMHGEPFEVSVKTLEVLGSPLLQKLCPPGPARVKFNLPLRRGMIRLSGSLGDEHLHLQIDGLWRGGTHSITFKSNATGLPLTISCRLPKEDLLAGNSQTITFNVDWQEWHGKAFASLPSFADLMLFSRLVTERRPIRTEWFLDGARMVVSDLTPGPSKPWLKTHTAFEFFERARYVARRFNMDLRFSKEDRMAESDREGVFVLEKLGKSAEFREVAEEASVMTFRGSLSDTWPGPESPEEVVSIAYAWLRFTVLDQIVTLKEVEESMTKVKVLEQSITEGDLLFKLRVEAGSERVLRWKTSDFSNV